jgi:hypothetical protein
MPLLETEREAPTRVDFHGNARDFQCVLLAALGMETNGICEETGYTRGKIEYRLKKAEEAERKQGKLSARKQWRKGTSPLCKTVLAGLTRTNSPAANWSPSNSTARGCTRRNPKASCATAAKTHC